MVGRSSGGETGGATSQESGVRAALPGSLDDAVAAATDEWETRGNVGRLWAGDASLWTGGDESRWLGWLHTPNDAHDDLGPVKGFGAAVARDGLTHAALLGMGGSSLCSEVLRRSFGHRVGTPDLRVLDSTDPAQLRTFERGLDLERTLFIVASKSGSTLEPTMFERYFFSRVAERHGPESAGSRFIAITDPGSGLDRLAGARKYRAVFHGVRSIGGRFSAISPFGLVPAAVMGIDVTRRRERAALMAEACNAGRPIRENPGVRLGVILGIAGLQGRDKITLILSPAINHLGAWIEQIVAESTGKRGIGLIPIDGEQIATPAVYGADRLFVYLRLDAEPDPEQDAAVKRIAAAGHPVVWLSVPDRYDLAGEFFRWEMATAVAGSVLGINPFDQPDVEAGKVATRRLTARYEEREGWPDETPIARTAYDGGEIVAFADERQAASLRATAGSNGLEALVAAHCGQCARGDYLAVLAYVERCEAHLVPLQRLRHDVRDARKVATTVGFGPRFLHSTGQSHKGGPATGVFLQVTCEDSDDVRIPGQAYTFGVVKAAQAHGDMEVLSERERRVLRLHVTGPLGPGLTHLADIVRASVRWTGGAASRGGPEPSPDGPSLSKRGVGRAQKLG